MNSQNLPMNYNNNNDDDHYFYTPYGFTQTPSHDLNPMDTSEQSSDNVLKGKHNFNTFEHHVLKEENSLNRTLENLESGVNSNKNHRIYNNNQHNYCGVPEVPDTSLMFNRKNNSTNMFLHATAKLEDEEYNHFISSKQKILNTTTTEPELSLSSTKKHLSLVALNNNTTNYSGLLKDFGWTFYRRCNELSKKVEYQAVVYSVQTLNTFHSSWELTEESALNAALYLAECTDSTSNDDITPESCIEMLPVHNSQHELSLISNCAHPNYPQTQITNNFTYNYGGIRDGIDLMRLASQSSEDHISYHMDTISNSSCASLKQRHSNNSSMTNTTEYPLETIHTITGLHKVDLQFLLNFSSFHHTVLIWLSYLPESLSPEKILGVWNKLLPSNQRILGLFKTKVEKEGLLLVDSLSSAVILIRNAKARQLELFNYVMSNDDFSLLTQPPSIDYEIFYDPYIGTAVGLALVNVSMTHPLCIHGFKRLSHFDVKALGHKRSAIETLRLLLTYAEASPIVTILPQSTMIASRTNFDLSTNTLSHSNSITTHHRRASFWCAICKFRAKDIPSAWRHLTEKPHEKIRQLKLDHIMKQIIDEFPEIQTTLLIDDNLNNNNNNNQCILQKEEECFF